jgi:ribosomal-protein-alanine N-acetyltransferase
MGVPQLETERCLLRLADPDDLHEVIRYWKQSGHRYSPPLPVELTTRSYWAERIVAARREFEAGSACKLYVFLRGSPRIIGTVTLTHIEGAPRHRAELGYAISAEHEGRGLMTEAVAAVTVFAFRDLRVHRIEASHALDNWRSRAVLGRLGFEREGELRDALYVNGNWQTLVLMSLLNADWSDSTEPKGERARR